MDLIQCRGELVATRRFGRESASQYPSTRAVAAVAVLVLQAANLPLWKIGYAAGRCVGDVALVQIWWDVCVKYERSERVLPKRMHQVSGDARSLAARYRAE